MADESTPPVKSGSSSGALRRAEDARDVAESARDVAQTGMRNTEEKLALLVSRVKDYAILMLDIDGNITTWNAGAERIKGYKASEIIGRNMSTFYTPEDVKKGLPQQLLRAAEKDGRVEDEGWRVRKDGTRFWADVIITALRDDDGVLRGYGKVTRDLTERKEAEEAREAARKSEERFSLLVSKVKDYAIFMLDPSGIVSTWNEGAERIKYYKADEIIGKHMSQFYTPEDQKRHHAQEILTRAKKEGRAEEEGWRVRKDGTRFWAHVVLTALRDEHGDLRGFAKVTRDLTERREAEQALGELSGRLMQTQDDERRRLARELHDSTSPLLTGLLAKLYAIKQRVPAARDDVLSHLLEDALMNAETTSTVVRSVAAMLHPPLLDESGVLPSLKWFINAYEKRTEQKIEARLPNSMPRLPRDTEIAIFRVAKDTISIVMAQAGARGLKVTVTVDGTLELAIEGDATTLAPGAFDDLKAGRGESGIILAGMRERMRQLGGKFDVSAAAGHLTVCLSLPLKGR